MFEAKPKAGEIPLPQPPAHHDDGDFTRFFNNPLPSSREPDWKAVERQPAPPPTRKADGDFTRMFGRVETPAAPSRSAPDAPASTGSSGGGGGNSGGVTDLFAKPKPVAQPAPAKGAPDDDFAKKFVPKADAPKVPELPGAVPVQMPPKKAPLLLLAIIVIALLIIGACALYYLVFRK